MERSFFYLNRCRKMGPQATAAREILQPWHGLMGDKAGVEIDQTNHDPVLGQGRSGRHHKEATSGTVGPGARGAIPTTANLLIPPERAVSARRGRFLRRLQTAIGMSKNPFRDFGPIQTGRRPGVFVVLFPGR